MAKRCEHRDRSTKTTVTGWAAAPAVVKTTTCDDCHAVTGISSAKLD
jgi:hypothetical protein